MRARPDRKKVVTLNEVKVLCAYFRIVYVIVDVCRLQTLEHVV